MYDRGTAAFLATIPVFAELDPGRLVELARVLRRRTVRAGEVLWMQGDEARELIVILDGAVTSSLHVPGGRVVEMARAGPGDIVGEIALLDGGPHTMDVRVVENATVLALGRQDFQAMLAGQDAATLGVRRRLAAVLTARYRNQLRRLAGSLGGGPPSAPNQGTRPADLEPTGPPDSRYIRRLGTFHDLDSLALWSLLTSGSYALCRPRRTLVVEGATSTACYLTINGAVEKVLVRGDRRIRVGLAGPGRAFGFESLIDAAPSPVTAITRERALLLVLPQGPFAQLFNGADAVSRVFLDVIQRELVSTLRETLRPHARLAASV
jgi:CRP-like cAMP-binding protein